MRTGYDARASVINEGTQEIQRLVLKITQLAGIRGEEFIKTFPFMHDGRNFRILNNICEELPPYKRNSFLGISFSSYHYINYIKFYSTYKSFPLNKGDEIILTFENKESLRFSFTSPGKSMGYLTTNTCAIGEMELAYIAENRLAYWKLYNHEKQQSVIGGFTRQEFNKQYISEKSGKELFKKMAEEILSSRQLLFNHSNAI
jgi:hypothetical protein